MLGPVCRPRYVVYPRPRSGAASAHAAVRGGGRASRAPVGVPVPLARVAAGGPFPGSCVVLIGDRKDPLRGEKTKSNFAGDLAAMAAAAKDNGIPSYEASNSENLAEEVSKAITGGCTDVAIFLAGHGLAPPGMSVLDGEPVRFTYPEGAVIVNSDPLADMAHNTELTPEGSPEPVLLPIVTAKDIAQIVKAHGAVKSSSPPSPRNQSSKRASPTPSARARPSPPRSSTSSAATRRDSPTHGTNQRARSRSSSTSATARLRAAMKK
jgi:hypothetical protein